MNNLKQNKSLISWIVGAIIVVLIIVGLASSHHKGNGSPVIDMTIATSTPDMSSSTPVMTEAKPTLAYSVYLATSTYSQSQSFDIIVSVLNLTDASTTLSFKNGCVGDYSIAGFDMLKHTICMPAPTSFSIPAHEVRQVKIVHYPSAFMIPAGKYTLTAGVVGYGSMTIPVTITN